MQEPELRKLVQQDLRVTAGAAVVALALYGVIAASHVGELSTTTAGVIEVAVSLMVCAVCIWRWASGPADMRGDRVFLLLPLFLIAAPLLIGLLNLGGGVAVAVASVAIGFAAAIALGILWGTRRRGA